MRPRHWMIEPERTCTRTVLTVTVCMPEEPCCRTCTSTWNSDKTNMLKTRPTQGTFGIHAAQVIAPGDPVRSVLLYRMAKLGSGRMPRIGSREVDLAGVRLLHDWLEQLPQDTDPESTADESVTRLRNAEIAALTRLQVTDSTIEQVAIVDSLLSSTTGRHPIVALR